jgi:RNA recognition motif-containing protein
MGKKSAAQIRRNQKRAQERGETYEAPVVQNDDNDEQNLEQMKYEAALKLKKSLDDLETNESNLNSKEKRSAKRKAEAVALEEVRKSQENGDENDLTAEHLLEWLEQNKSKFQAESDTGPVITKKQRKKLNAAKTYLATLKEIEKNEDLVAKNRRSAKKKAEAIACEAGQVEDIEELLEYYESNKDLLPEKKKKRKAKEAELDENGQEVTKKKNPYILFVGQIPYDTTVDTLFSHFEKYMGKSLITKETLKIRIPNNDKDKDKQSKGFAFAEFTDPETMYECLKMHHTPLNGRRINVIRAAGGGKAARAETFKQRKIEQDDYISTTVDKIISDYIKDGKLKEGELDKGAILLCKRRSAATVEAALAEYIEQRGDRQFDNPSAFFTTVMIQVTDDGPVKNKNGKKPNFKGSGSEGRSAREGGKGPSKVPKEARSKDASVFTKSGVDMSISEKDPSAENNLSRIFPSMGRGRGRGRGAYMR